MKLIIHDLEEEKFKYIEEKIDKEIRIIFEDNKIHNCIGCFGCWIKTPGACIIRDSYGDMGEILSKCEKVTIISKCFYGGFSPFVKNVLDRSISYIHPYFKLVNGEMHHRSRYDNHFTLNVIFYGEDITEKEKQTAEKLVKANFVNLKCISYKVSFVNDIEKLEDKTI